MLFLTGLVILTCCLMQPLLAQQCNCMFGMAVLILSQSGTALQGSSIRLNCTATLPLLSTGHCEPENCGTISWYHGMTSANGSPSEREFENALLTITSQLELSSITTANAGKYTCQVSITDNFIEAAATVLTVSKLQITGNYDQLTVGSDLVLTCSLNQTVSGSLFRWTTDSGSVVSNSSILQQGPVSTAMNGTVYTCSVSSENLVSGGSTSVTVTVREPIVYITGVHNNLAIGSTAVINCTAPSVGDSMASWYSDGSVVSSTGVLILPSVDNTINGRDFTCTVSSPHITNNINQTITVTIQDTSVNQVSIVNPPSYVVDGDQTVELQCTVTLNHHIGPDYSALRITWTDNTNTVHNCPHPHPQGISNTFTCNLTLATVSATNAGVYTCSGEVTGSNIHRADFLVLKVEGSLQSVNLHTPKNAVLGQSSVLTCEVNTSLPVTTSLLSVQWMHRGNAVTITSSQFVLKPGSTSVYVTELTLSETTVEQSGLYSCNVFLDTDRQQLTTEGSLIVGFSHVDILITPSDGFPTQPLLSTSTRLICFVTLHPQINPSTLTIQYQWSSNGEQRGSGQELALSDLSPDDATTYSCQVMVLPADPMQAMIRQISNDSTYTLVIKIPPPSVQRSPSETRTILYIGEDVSITCTSNVIGVVFTWRAINSLTQQPVVISNITTHPTPHSSVFKPTVVDDTIVDVFCSVTIASNNKIAAGEASSFIQLIVPMWSVSVSSSASTVLDVSQYNSFTVMCGATFQPSYIPRVSFTFMLTKNNKPVTDTLSTSPVMAPSPTNVYQNTSVNQAALSGPDTLTYNCTVVLSVNGSHITTDSSTTQVNVKGPSLPAAPVVHQPPVTSPTSAVIQWSVPEVTYSPEQYTVYYTINSSSCSDSDEGYDKSVTVYGLNHTEFYTIRNQQYSVTLSNLHPYIVYCYKVVVTNTVGRKDSTLNTFVTNEDVPSGPPQNFTITYHLTSTTAVLSWSPPLLLQRNGVITSYYVVCIIGNVTGNVRISSTTVELALEPFTSYKCSVSATNAIGDGPSASISGLSNEDIPGSPSKFMGISESSTSIVLTWSAPVQPNGVIAGYTLQCRSAVGETHLLHLMSSQTTNVLSGLLPYTNYSCSITAHTSAGEGPAATTSVTTEQDVPSGSPENFIISVTSRTLNLSWSPPLPSKRSGIIVYYIIICSSGGSTILSTSTNASIDENEYQLTNLQPGVRYSCSVSASTVVGAGPAAAVNVITDEERPGPPHGLSASEGSTSVSLMWSMPLEPNGVIAEYQVQCTGGGQMFPVTVTGSQTTAILTKLVPYTNYSCSITAYTSAGGGPAATISINTEQDVPSKVRSVTVQSLDSSTTMLIVTWQPPADTNGVITKYELDVATSTATVNNIDISSDTLRQTINDLFPQVPYYIKIAAYTVKGRGPYSVPVANFTMEGVPMSGPTPNTTRLNDTTVAVSWRPLTLEEARGFIIGYTVTAEPKDDRQRQVETLSVMVGPNKNMAIIQGLVPNQEYWVIVAASTTAGTSTNNMRVSVGVLPQGRNMTIVIIAVVVCCVLISLLILILIIFISICCLNRRKKSHNLNLKITDRPNTIEAVPMKYEEPPYKEKLEQQESSTSNQQWRLQPIMVEAFPDHVKGMHRDRDEEFENEYNTFGSIAESSHHIAMLSHNIKKNRFQNILPYDHSRVMLTMIEEVDGSDYINASWIDGYRRKRAYIAAQGPLKNTVEDFWRMVWEQRLTTIVMLTQLVEAAKTKCCCYWPDKVNEIISMPTGLVVRLTEETDYNGFKMRKLLLINTYKQGSKPLVVTHYYFTEWPDHGVPRDKMSMIHFIKQVRRDHHSDGPPLLVHCSAGVGRTGTFIVLDKMLQKIAAEGSLNIYETVVLLRQQRCFMVQMLSQYVYIHDALAEYILCGDTSFSLLDAHKKLAAFRKNKGGKSGYLVQFDLLNLMSKDLHDTSTNDAESSVNAGKNRYTYNLPFNHNRVHMISRAQLMSRDYINASWVNGYWKNKGFIAAQAPMESTVEDMWQMVVENKCKTIVLLCSLIEDGKEVCEEYWPTVVGETLTAGKMSVHLISDEKTNNAIIRKFQISKKELHGNIGSDISIEVTQFHYLQWPTAGTPRDTVSFLQLVEDVMISQNTAGSGPIIVMCNDGVSRTGAFITIYSQIERMKNEQTADIFQFVKSSRLQRKGFIRQPEHYIFCYNALEELINQVEKQGNIESDV